MKPRTEAYLRRARRIGLLLAFFALIMPELMFRAGVLPARESGAMVFGLVCLGWATEAHIRLTLAHRPNP